MGSISIKNLVHRFSKYGDNGEEIGEKTALEQVSLDIEKGSFVAKGNYLTMNDEGKLKRSDYKFDVTIKNEMFFLFFNRTSAAGGERRQYGKVLIL